MTDLPEMPCRELVEVITAYLEDALPERDRRRFEAHLEACEDCREYVAQFRRTIALVGRVQPDGLSPRAREELLAAFRGLRM
jgi:anti-sigma factor RsiW